MAEMPGPRRTHHHSWSGSAPKTPPSWVLSTLPFPGAGPCRGTAISQLRFSPPARDAERLSSCWLDPARD